MCGVFGVVSKKNIAPNLSRRMSDLLRHRGPDDHGVYRDESALLGQTRLSILDLETGNQPIFNEDRTMSIVFNGEIYNYLYLREQLLTKGHRFCTESDTEVILHLYEEYGDGCLDRLNGMFAFAIWDSTKKVLFIARDRFGIKPLVYYADGKRFIFASEIKAITADATVPRRLDWEALGDYLSFNYIPAPRTIYKDIFKLEPGSQIKVGFETSGRVKVVHKRWYSLHESVAGRPAISALGDAGERLRVLLEDSVRNHMISDVQLGAFLSGGIDSSVVVGLMARNATGPVKTFSIGYKDFNLFDETKYAREVAGLNSTEHHEFKLGHDDVLGIIPQVLDGLDEPFADWSIFPTYLVSRETKNHVKVALSGDGADEVFGGYRKYLGEYYYGYYSKLPGPLKSMVIEPIVNSFPDSYNSRIFDYSRRVKKFISGLDSTQARRHFGWMQIFSEDFIRDALTRRALDKMRLQSYALIESLYARSKGDATNRMLSVDIMCCLPYDMLAKVDMMSMLNSIEVRIPFLDHRVVELALSMTGSLKLNGRKRKYVLVDTFKEILPKSLHNRPKQGFDVPIGEWFKKELRDVFHLVVSEVAVREAGVFNYEFVSKLYACHVSKKRDYTKELLNIFIFQWWFKNARPSL